MIFPNQQKENSMQQSISFGEYDFYEPTEGIQYFQSLLNKATIGTPLEGPFVSSPSIDLTGSAMHDLFEHHPRKKEILAGEKGARH